MKITFGQISIEGADMAEIHALIALIPALQAFQPATVGTSHSGKASVETPAFYTAEQITQANEAIAKGYSFEASYKLIAKVDRLRRSGEERARGLNAEQTALERLQAIASGTGSASPVEVSTASNGDPDLEY